MGEDGERKGAEDEGRGRGGGGEGGGELRCCLTVTRTICLLAVWCLATKVRASSIMAERLDGGGQARRNEL